MVVIQICTCVKIHRTLWDTCLAELEEHMIRDLEVVHLNPTLGAEIT